MEVKLVTNIGSLSYKIIIVLRVNLIQWYFLILDCRHTNEVYRGFFSITPFWVLG